MLCRRGLVPSFVPPVSIIVARHGFRECAPFLADVQRAEDAGRSELIPMVFGAVQAVGQMLDGTRIGLGPNAGRGTSPAVEIKMPGYSTKQITFNVTDR